MFRRLMMLGVLSGLVWAAAVVPASAAAPSWTVTQIATGPAAPYYIGVSGERVVWQDTLVSPRSLWTWKAGSAPLKVQEDWMWYAPRVSGDRIAWICTGGSESFRVYTWRAGDLAPTVVTSSTTAVPDELQVSGDRLVWQVGYNKVLTWKVNDAHPTTLNVGPYQAANPQVDGDRVVWEESNGSAWQIATCEVGEDSVWVTNDSRQHGYPAVSGERIAWTSEVEDLDHWAIYTRTRTESVPTTVALTTWGDTPLISGDRIAWLHVPEGSSVQQVFTWKVGDHDAQQISAGTSNQSYLDVSGDRLVWVDGIRVLTWAAGDATASVVATGAAVWDTRISGDRVAWINGAKVMTAVLRTPTKLGTPTVSPTKPTHNKHAHFYAVLTPGSARTAAGATTTLKLYRKETRYVTKKVHGVNKRVKESYWHLRNSVVMKRYSSTSTSVKMTATVTPKYAGSWKAVVVYGGASGFIGSTSPTKYFTVK